MDVTGSFAAAVFSVEGCLGSAVELAIKEAKEQGFTEGRKVCLAGDAEGEQGEIIGYNTRTHSLYNGVRYPVLVKWARGVFEYSTDGLILIPEVTNA